MVRFYGDDSFDFLRDLIWTGRFPAAGRVAIEQIVKSEGDRALPWLTTVAEKHQDNACRACAAEEVIKRKGLVVCEWALQILRFDDNPLVAWSTGHALYSLSDLEAGRGASEERNAAAAILKNGLPRFLDGSGRECVIGAAILLSNKSPSDRDWATSAAVETPSAYHRVRALAIVLRHWPGFSAVIKQLEAVAHGSDELIRDQAEGFLKWNREENWRTFDWHLGLGRR